MKLYLKRSKGNINAKALFDEKTNKVTVLKGSVLSENVTVTPTFRGGDKIKMYRDGIVKNNILQKDIEFKSASTAANFVTGSSTNGTIAWKNVDGLKLKELINKK